MSNKMSLIYLTETPIRLKNSCFLCGSVYNNKINRYVNLSFDLFF